MFPSPFFAKIGNTAKPVDAFTISGNAPVSNGLEKSYAAPNLAALCQNANDQKENPPARQLHTTRIVKSDDPPRYTDIQASRPR